MQRHATYKDIWKFDVFRMLTRAKDCGIMYSQAFLLCSGRHIGWENVKLFLTALYLYSCFRFASSKSGKIYLHTDIRVIFARQPPDLGHLCQLYTITDGPTDPKFTERHHISMDPECWGRIITPHTSPVVSYTWMILNWARTSTILRPRCMRRPIGILPRTKWRSNFMF